MSSTAQQTMSIIEKLDDASQITILRFAEFLAAESDDATLYDEAKSNDDGYRIASTELRAKYGL